MYLSFTSPSSPTTTPVSNGTIMAILALGCIGAFISGFFISDLYRQTNTPTVLQQTPSPTPKKDGTQATPTDVPSEAIEQLNFDTGNHYFDDTVLFITTDTPHQVLIGSMVRVEEDKKYIYNTRVSFYDGTKWERKTGSQKTDTPKLITNDLVQDWSINIDATRLLKEQVKGTIQVGANSMKFQSSQLQNELGIRSLPGYTKFMSEGNGQLTINGISHPAKALYTRIYSMNTADIQFYNEPIGVTTDWIAFWDANGNFYHVDSTSVSKPTPIYKTHTLGILKTALGAVSKTFNINTTRDTNTPPDAYTVSLQYPIGATLSLQRKSSINKAPNGTYDWYMGTVEGSVTSSTSMGTSGYGVIEYIHD
jgi:hypothetical protein